MVLPLCKEWLRDFNGDKYNCEFFGNTLVLPAPAAANKIMMLTKISGSDIYFDPTSIATWDGSVILNDIITVTYNIVINITVTTVGNITIDVNSIGISDTRLAANVVVGVNTFTYSGTATLTPSALTDDANAITISFLTAAIYTVADASLTITDTVVVTPTEVNALPSVNFISRQFTTVNSLVPDLKQSDLLVTYLKLTCSLIQVDEVNKNIKIIPFEKLNDNIANALDWSNKLDLTDTPQITFAVDGYAQRNLCTWQYDEILTKRPLANGVIQLDDQNLDDEQDLIDIDFSATPQALKSGFNISFLPIFNSGGTFRDAIDQRILFAKFNDVAFTYTDGTTNSAQTTDILLTHFQKSGEINLGFDDNLIPTFYQAFIDVLDKAKIVTCLLRLNASDINQLDLTIPVYIEYFNSYFYVSKISGYNPNRNVSTLVELVKLY
jgi:hypothetical protein